MATIQLPVKRAIDISKNYLMGDGVWLDHDNQFNVRTVSDEASETEIRDSIIKTCKFMCLRDLLLHLHKYHKEASYYQTLGIQGNPYSSFDEFYGYVHQSCLTNEPSQIESINAHYQHLCTKNNLSDGELFPAPVEAPAMDVSPPAPWLQGRGPAQLPTPVPALEQ